MASKICLIILIGFQILYVIAKNVQIFSNTDYINESLQTMYNHVPTSKKILGIPEFYYLSLEKQNQYRYVNHFLCDTLTQYERKAELIILDDARWKYAAKVLQVRQVQKIDTLVLQKKAAPLTERLFSLILDNRETQNKIYYFIYF